MDICFNCPHCDQHLTVDESGAGMTVNCPSCNQPIEIPRTAAPTPTQPPPVPPQPPTPIYAMQGVQDLLEVYPDKVTITPKGILGFLNKGLGTKSIPFTSITAIRFRKADLVSGYLQFTILGGIESRGGGFAAASDENTFMFRGGNDVNQRASEIKEYIEAKVEDMRIPRQTTTTLGLSEELQKLATLRAEGVLSDSEFIAAKKRLLG
jgi:hypothetical protein